MKKLIHTLCALLIGMQWVCAQTDERGTLKMELLTPIEIDEERKNDYTGNYAIQGVADSIISVELNEDDEGNTKMAIIIPTEKTEDGFETNVQYTLIPQYEDKFYLNHDAFIKVHFTRSKRSNEVISLLFNANGTEGAKIIRAKKVE